MSTKEIITCDGCGVVINAKAEYYAPFKITVSRYSGTRTETVRHLCSPSCAERMLVQDAWPELELPVKNQVPPAGSGPYRGGGL